jgi:hypothetical protein
MKKIANKETIVIVILIIIILIISVALLDKFFGILGLFPAKKSVCISSYELYLNESVLCFKEGDIIEINVYVDPQPNVTKVYLVVEYGGNTENEFVPDTGDITHSTGYHARALPDMFYAVVEPSWLDMMSDVPMKFKIKLSMKDLKTDRVYYLYATLIYVYPDDTYVTRSYQIVVSASEH